MIDHLPKTANRMTMTKAAALVALQKCMKATVLVSLQKDGRVPFHRRLYYNLIADFDAYNSNLHHCQPRPICATSRFSIKIRQNLSFFSIPLTSKLSSSACIFPKSHHILHERYNFPACHSSCVIH
jgi:hypothetical protein